MRVRVGTKSNGGQRGGRIKKAAPKKAAPKKAASKKSSGKPPAEGKHVLHVQADMAKLKDLPGAVNWLRTAHLLTWRDLHAKFESAVQSAAARQTILDRATPSLLLHGTDHQPSREPILDAIMLWWYLNHMIGLLDFRPVA